MMMRTGRTLMGCAYGSTRPQVDFPRLIALYQAGRLKLDELISRRFSLDEINDAFHALEAGQVARGVIVYS
jgi:S-(hydroxymethyl)glutathione dehydrogenase/alcohol dehydrogenase